MSQQDELEKGKLLFEVAKLQAQARRNIAEYEALSPRRRAIVDFLIRHPRIGELVAWIPGAQSPWD